MDSPLITGGGNLLAEYKFGEHSGVFIEKPDSVSPIKYLYLLIIYSLGDEESPILFVTAEKNEMHDEFMKHAGKEYQSDPNEYFLAVYTNQGHENHGKSSEWNNFSTFKEKAIQIAKDKLALTDHDIHHTDQTKSQSTIPTTQTSSGTKTIITYFTFLVGLILLASLYNSDAVQEKLNPYKYWNDKKLHAEEMINYSNDQIRYHRLEYQKLRKTRIFLVKQYELEGFTHDQARNQYKQDIEDTRNAIDFEEDILKGYENDLTTAKKELISLLP